MPLYFFHIHANAHDADDEGMDFADPGAAREEAIKVAGEMMRDSPDAFWDSQPWKVVVTDEAGAVLWQISMDAVSGGEPSAAGP